MGALPQTQVMSAKPPLPIVRIKPTPENLALMVDIFCASIESGILPAVNSPVHHAARWLVDDSGHKHKRIRTRLKHLKPKSTLE